MIGIFDQRPTYHEVLERHQLSPADVAQKAEIACAHSQVLYEGEKARAFYADALLWAVFELTGERYTRETIRVDVIEESEESCSSLTNSLRWNATAHGWVTCTGDTSLFVSEKAHDQHLKAFLLRQGIERKTRGEYMRPAEAAWQRQCEAETILQRNIDYWLACSDPGIEVFRRT